MSPANRLVLVAAIFLAATALVACSTDSHYLRPSVEAKVSAALSRGASDEAIDKILTADDHVERSVLDKASDIPTGANIVDDVEDSAHTADPKTEWFSDYKTGGVTTCEYKLKIYLHQFREETRLRNEEKRQIVEIKKLVDELVGIKDERLADISVANHKAMTKQLLLEEKNGRAHQRLVGSSGAKGVVQLIGDLIAKIERDQRLHYEAWRRTCNHCLEECRKAIAMREEAVKTAITRLNAARVFLEKKIEEREFVEGLLTEKLKELAHAEWQYTVDDRVRVREMEHIKELEDKMEVYIRQNKGEGAELSALAEDWTTEVSLSEEQQAELLQVLDTKEVSKMGPGMANLQTMLARPHSNCGAIKKLLQELREKILEERRRQQEHIASLKQQVADLRKRLAALVEEVRLARIAVENREHELKDRKRELAHTKMLCDRIKTVTEEKDPAAMTEAEQRARAEFLEMSKPTSMQHSLNDLADLAASM